MARIRAALSRNRFSQGPFGLHAGLAALRASRFEAKSSAPRTLGEETSAQGPPKNQGLPIIRAAAKPDARAYVGPGASSSAPYAGPGASHSAPPPKAPIQGPPPARASTPKAVPSTPEAAPSTLEAAESTPEAAESALEVAESTPEAAAATPEAATSTPEAVALCMDGTTPKASVKAPIVVDGSSATSPALVKARTAAEDEGVVGQIPTAPAQTDAPLPEWKHPEMEIETEEAAKLPMASEDLASRETDSEPSLEDSTPKVAEESSPEFVKSPFETQPEPQVYEPPEHLPEWRAEDEIESQPAAPLPKARPVPPPEPEKTWEEGPPEPVPPPEPEKTWEGGPPEPVPFAEPEKAWEGPPPEPVPPPEPEKTWAEPPPEPLPFHEPEKTWEGPLPEPETPPEPEKTWEGSKSSSFRYPHVWHKSSYGWQDRKFDNKWSPDATADESTWSGSWGWKSRGKWSPSSWKSGDWEQQPDEVDNTQQNEVENWEQQPEEQNEVENWEQQREEQNEVENWEQRREEQNEVENWEQQREEQNEVENWHQEPEEQNEVKNWYQQPEEQNEVENWYQQPEEQNEVENWEQQPEEVDDSDTGQKEVKAPEKLEGKNDEAEGPEDPEALPEGHFSVMLTKNHDENWGFNWDPQSRAKGFRYFVEATKGCPIDLWNHENPSKAVAFGDELVEVNSAKTADKITVELTKPMVFCVFKRADPMTGQDPPLEDQGDTGPAVVTTSIRSVPVRPKTLPPPPSYAKERRLPSGTLVGGSGGRTPLLEKLFAFAKQLKLPHCRYTQ